VAQPLDLFTQFDSQEQRFNNVELMSVLNQIKGCFPSALRITLTGHTNNHENWVAWMSLRHAVIAHTSRPKRDANFFMPYAKQGQPCG